MKTIISILLIMNFNIYAGFMSETDVGLANSDTSGAFSYQKKKECEDVEGEACHNTTGKDLRFWTIQGGLLLEDATLKAAAQASDSTSQSEVATRKTEADAGSACLDAVADPDALTGADTLAMIKCLVKTLRRPN